MDEELWAAAVHEGTLYGHGYGDEGVVEISRSGVVTPVGVDTPVARDHCLMTVNDALYYIGKSTIHQLRAGTWTAFDIASQPIA